MHKSRLKEGPFWSMTGERIKEIEQPEIKKYSPRPSKILSASPNSTCMIFSIIGYMGEALVLNHTTLGLLGHPEPGPFLPPLLHHSCGQIPAWRLLWPRSWGCRVECISPLTQGIVKGPCGCTSPVVPVKGGCLVAQLEDTAHLLCWPR